MYKKYYTELPHNPYQELQRLNDLIETDIVFCAVHKIPRNKHLTDAKHELEALLVSTEDTNQ